MDAFTASLVIQWYEDIEQRLLDVLSLVPFIPENYGVFSPRFPGLITETCDVLDSLFREIAPESSPGEVSVGRTTNGRTTKKKEDLKIWDYGWIYASKLNPSITRSFVFVSPPTYLFPFQDWSSAPAAEKRYPSPSWWKVYNKQKHSRLQDIRKATLRITVEALCGLHQAIVKTTELAEAIMRHRWAPTGGYSPHTVLEVLRNQHSPIQHGDTFFVETKLFALPFGARPFPEKIEDIRSIDYTPAGLSPRLGSFLGR